MSYLTIKEIRIPLQCINQAYGTMRDAGSRGLEGVALFAGIENGNIFEIMTTIIPKQNALNLEGGLLYSVDGEELHKIDIWLYNNKQSLIAQIHSHPGEAYHSETDDAYPIIAVAGGISIVVPDFAIGPIEIRQWAAYRLHAYRKWVRLSEEEKAALIKII